MTQKAKKWLSKQPEVFTINKQDSGIVGSLVGLGYVERLPKMEYRITTKGKEWIKYRE